MCDTGGQSARHSHPLHWCVWHDNVTDLSSELLKPNVELERRDGRGRTALMLAVTLCRVECAQLLLTSGSSVLGENREGWSMSEEAVATGCRQLVALVLRERHVQRHSRRATTLPMLLRRLTEVPDFYVEIKWEFSSWVPLVSRMCPRDTYRVYKQGSRVRIDTTLLGFDQSAWQRSNRTYVFKRLGDRVLMTEIDHERRVFCSEQLPMDSAAVLGTAVPTQPHSAAAAAAAAAVAAEGTVESRLAAPIVNTYVNLDNISIERSKSGVWGWRSDRSENVDGCVTHVYTANNVELVTKTRTEHLSRPVDGETGPQDTPETPAHNDDSLTADTCSSPSLSPPSPLASMATSSAHCEASSASVYNPAGVTAEEYFGSGQWQDGRDVGREQQCQTKVHRLKATIWLCREYPISLSEQLVPIIDLLSIHSCHYSRLKQFIQMQLPTGFPIKIEIPLFHVVTARVTFCNIFAQESAVEHVSTVRQQGEEEDAAGGGRVSCVVDDAAFSIPAGYSDSDGQVGEYEAGESASLQYAIEQSLLESGSEHEQVDIWEALRSTAAATTNHSASISTEDRHVQRVIQLSLTDTPANGNGGGGGSEEHKSDGEEDDLTRALRLSRDEQLQLATQQEEQQLQLALQQSLVDQ